MLHRSRHHQHVLLLYGFTCLPPLDEHLEPEGRLALVTERIWGTVQAALRMGSLVCQAALTIAAQVAAALEYLDAMKIEHGAVRTENVALIADPRDSAKPLIAKLMTFSDADELGIGTTCVRDLHGYVVFNYNILVRNYGGSELDGADLTTEALFASRDAVFGEHFPDHSHLFKSLCNERTHRASLAAHFARIDAWTTVPSLSQLLESTR